MIYRPELEPPTERIRALPVHRGYPVPWFVDWITADGKPALEGEGTPEFRAMDIRKFARALKQRLCWVCGQRLGTYLTFAGGPMCGVNRTYSEPPSHKECAVWSARNCPFLARPHMVRLHGDLPADISMSGHGLLRNPGVAMIWTTRNYTRFWAQPGDRVPLIRMGDPISVEWYAEGRPATREEVAESIRTGLPVLLSLCDTERDREFTLKEAREFEEQYLPKAA